MQSCSDEEFIRLLAQLDIHMRVQDGKLRISAPAGALDDGCKAELVRRKDALLTLLEAQAAPGPWQDASSAPLSYAQERLWLLERFHPGNFAYNIAESFVIPGAVDRSLMQRAIDFVSARHATLRTSIVEDQHGTARQHIHPAVVTPLQFVDLQKLQGAAQQERLQRMLRGLAREPFDLRVAPLVRFFLIQLKADTFVAFINMHHIVSDRWSTRVLYRELIAVYTAFTQGREPELPALPMQYADHARRERGLEAEAQSVPGARSLQQQLAYWQQQLAGLPDLPVLPFRQTPATPRPFEGAMSPLAFADEDAAGIRLLARRHNASPYMVVLAAFAALLHRYSGVTDVCIGSPVSERTTTDTEGLIGLFVNTLVMRCAVTSDLSFEQLLRDVRETVLDAQANHKAPLQRILRELHATGVSAAQPLFETMLGFDAYMGTGDGAEQVAVDPGVAKFEMTLQLYEERERIGGWIEYRTDLFPAKAIERFGSAFLLLLRDAVRDPAIRVGRLAILSGAERHRLLKSWNSTGTAFARDRTIHQLFEEQVGRTPDATALIDGTTRLSYRELNRRANRIAHGLLALRLPGEAIIGIHLERTAEMVAAMLGILKAGGAYLPLDPHYPAERLRVMLEDSRCSVVLSETAGTLAATARMLPTAFAGVAAQMLDRNPDAAVPPSHLAYVIYTSGSTGRPKGVAVEHRNTVAFLDWAMQTFPRAILHGTLAATSISFDLSVFEIFVPLVSGNTVILAADVLALPALPAAAEVTLVTTVPSAAAALLAARGLPATVRAINLAGEALSTRLVDRLYSETAVADVNDLYGPTETTTYSTWNRRLPGKAATIGRPVANTRVYLVDAALELVPMGVPGELLIAGEGVARGYLNNPGRTQEKFVSLAHVGEPGRAYRTGDLCRYTSDGVLEYLGRMDTQLKVRGFRIEVAEVEAALMAHPTVREAVVMARSDGDSGSSLAACVILHDGESFDGAALIEHQARTLPAHMVAHHLAVIAAFPRTANGKIDRRQLALESFTAISQNSGVAPRDELERGLAAIWQQGFGVASIGIDDDFFQLGGHSLLALRLFAEMESKLGVRMMLSSLFEAPTIRRLADLVRVQRGR